MSKRKAKSSKPSTVEPTKERRQHSRLVSHDSTGVAGLFGRRVQPPIERLYKRTSIEARQYSAAQQYRDDYEIAEGAKDMDGELPPGIRAGTREGLTIRQIDAMEARKAARAVIGRHDIGVVDRVVVHEQSLQHAAQDMGMDQKRLTGRLDSALHRLADHYRL